jgi:hypothetical protein
MSQIIIPAKRRNAILKILNDYDSFHETNVDRNVPLDLYLRYFFLDHKKDFDDDARGQISDMVYFLQRYKGYLNAISSRKSTRDENRITWEARFKAFQTPDFPDLFDHPAIPEHARCSIPKEMYELMQKGLGFEKAFEVGRICLERPLPTIRANTLKTSRKELMDSLIDYKFDVRPCKFAPNGIRFA